MTTTSTAWQADVAGYLRAMHYTPAAVAGAVDHLARRGSVEGCEHVELEDRPAVAVLFHRHVGARDETVAGLLDRQGAIYARLLDMARHGRDSSADFRALTGDLGAVNARLLAAVAGR